MVPTLILHLRDLFGIWWNSHCFLVLPWKPFVSMRRGIESEETCIFLLKFGTGQYFGF